MELPHGESLATRLRRQRLSNSEVESFAIQISYWTRLPNILDESSSSRIEPTMELPMIPAPPPKLLELLTTRETGVADLTLALRELVLEEAPESTEFVHDVKYAIALNYTFTGKMKGAFVHVVAYTKHVNLGFWAGADLTDPRKLLQGDGKKIRHIRFESRDDVARAFVRKFLREAIAKAAR